MTDGKGPRHQWPALLVAGGLALWPEAASAQDDWPSSLSAPAQDPPGYVDPQLSAGIVLAALGGASVIAGTAWYAAYDEPSCSTVVECGPPFHVAGGVGLIATGLTASALGVGAIVAASDTPPGFEQERGMIGAGMVLTGLCAATAIGSSAALVHLSERDDLPLSGGLPILLGGAPGAALGPGVMCGIGVPLWVRGMQPDIGPIDRERALGLASDDWPVRSRTMTAVGASMLGAGTFLAVGGFSYGFVRLPRNRGDPPPAGAPRPIPDRGYEWFGGFLFMAPAVPLLVSGGLLLSRGATSVPPGWTISLGPPPTPLGIGLSLSAL